jgi:hypothetical protein
VTLEPRLTALDEAVFDALPAARPGRRARRIAQIASSTMPRRLGSVTETDVRLILRGFEHLGRAAQINGWWARAA